MIMRRSKTPLVVVLGVGLLLMAGTATTTMTANAQSTDPASSSSSQQPFSLMDGFQVVKTIKSLQKTYPHFVKATNAQDAYGLPPAGNRDNDCPYDRVYDDDNDNDIDETSSIDQVGCLTHFFTIQDYIVHAEGSKSSQTLPEVLLLGSLHGGETELGPTVVLNTASLLIEAADCEAKPRRTMEHHEWDDEIQEALDCREELRSKGIDDTHRQWLARLMSTRRIVVVPNANALGMYRNQFTEDGVDPATDFPYNNFIPEECMRTITARTLNELFHHHMFQLVLTFASGENSIDYSWGTQNALTPDLMTTFDVAQSMSTVAGGKGKYPFGQERPEDAKYRFQDWAYAGSWENLRMMPCNPQTYGGYNYTTSSSSDRDGESGQPHPGSTNRAASFTVSTQAKNDIEGLDERYGTIWDVFHADDNSDGLAISRNIRIALVAVDLVQPYASIFGVNALGISDDVVPSSPRPDSLCDTSRAIAVPISFGSAIVEWTVGGSLDINQTDLWVARSADFKEFTNCYLNFDDDNEQFTQIFRKMKPLTSASTNGNGFFSDEGAYPHPWTSFSKPFDFVASGSTPHLPLETNSMGSLSSQPTSRNVGNNQTNVDQDRSVKVLGPVFRAEIEFSDFVAGELLVVVATARVDPKWGEPPSGYFQPVVHPQSHLANTRTRPEYEFLISGKTVEGQSHWVSNPVTILLQNLDEKRTVELYKRLDESSDYQKPPTGPSDLFDGAESSSSSSSDENSASTPIYIAAGVFGLMLVSLAMVVIHRRHRRARPSTFSSSNEGLSRGPTTTGSHSHTGSASSREGSNTDSDMSGLSNHDIHLHSVSVDNRTLAKSGEEMNAVEEEYPDMEDVDFDSPSDLSHEMPREVV